MSASSVAAARLERAAQRHMERHMELPGVALPSVKSLESRWDEIGCTQLKAASDDTILLDAAWLAELADRGECLPRCQDVPEEAKVSLAEMEAWRYGPGGGEFTVGALVISYPWLDKNHPDPHAETLRKIAFVLKSFAAEARKHKGCRVGVFWDYCSLPQRDGDGVDDRSEAELARFQRALRSINTWYGHQKSYVLLVRTPLPSGHTYANTQPYDGRGWCVAESVMSAIVKDDGALIDLRHLTGSERTISELVRSHGKHDGKGSSREPPIAPDAFSAKLEAGVRDGRIKFTNNGDVGLVTSIYERAFMSAMSDATQLYYESCGWGDEQAATLAAALEYASKHGATQKLRLLNLDGNQIGDGGAAALAAAGREGAAPMLETWYMANNQIADDGAQAIAAAGRAGAFPKLSAIVLDGNSMRKATMKAVRSFFNRGRAAASAAVWKPQGAMRTLQATVAARPL